MRRRFWILVACSVTPIACDEPPRTRKLQDSEGRHFAATCTEDDPCTLKQVSGNAWPGSAAFALSAKARIQGICAVDAAGAPLGPGACRALVCQADTDCPPTRIGPNGTCLDGVCTDLERDLGPDDAVMLCLWGTGLGSESTEQIERAAMGLNCGKPCKIPAPCHPL